MPLKSKKENKNNIQKKIRFQKKSKIQFIPLKSHFMIFAIYAPKIENNKKMIYKKNFQFQKKN
jgi:sortase (surface protein transpeptidase)